MARQTEKPVNLIHITSLVHSVTTTKGLLTMNKLIQLAASALLATGLGFQVSAAQADGFSISYSSGYLGHINPYISHNYNRTRHNSHDRPRHYRHYDKHNSRHDDHHKPKYSRHDRHHDRGHGQHSRHRYGGHRDSHHSRHRYGGHRDSHNSRHRYEHRDNQHSRHEKTQRERHHAAVNRAHRR
ncbi:MAG: hypothetical protein V3V50_03850 [Gammaproteobacteria bacterium]